MNWKATCVLAALGAALVAAPDAADARGRGARKRSVRFESLDGSRARGRATVMDRRRGRRITLRFRGLEARTVYDIVTGADAPIAIGSVRSSRRGRARLRLRDAPAGMDSLEALASVSLARADRAIAILRADLRPDVPGTPGDPALEDPPVIDVGRLPGARVLAIDGKGGHSLEVAILSGGDPLAGEHVAVLLRVAAGGVETFHAFQRVREYGEALPFGLERAVDLAARAFEIRDASGDPVVAGSLPRLVHESPFFKLRMEEDEVAPPGPGRNVVTIPGAGPPSGYTLWIADELGVLVRAGDLLEYPAGRLGVMDGRFYGWDGRLGEPRPVPPPTGADPDDHGNGAPPASGPGPRDTRSGEPGNGVPGTADPVR